MDITEKEFKEQYYKTIEGILITPIFKYDEFDQETETYKNLVITKTTDEVYQEYLNPPASEKTDIEKLQEENANLSNILDSILTDIIPSLMA